MRRRAWAGALLLALIARGWASGGEPACWEADRPCFLQRVGPGGGWCPYGGLLHWWNPYCFPRCGAPDDYCRKKLPWVCWPPYPYYYIWGPPALCSGSHPIPAGPAVPVGRGGLVLPGAGGP
jgi:hypothetical protein